MITGPHSFRDLVAECEKDEAIERMEEIRNFLKEECLHYGRTWVKFDGGRCPMFCGLCGEVIGQWFAPYTRE